MAVGDLRSLRASETSPFSGFSTWMYEMTVEVMRFPAATERKKSAITMDFMLLGDLV